MSSTEFVGKARFLNYRRLFPTPVSAIVRIPTIPYEAFDNTGTKVQLWSLANLIESAMVYGFAKGPSLEFPNTSLVDMTDILQEYYIFIVSSSLHVEKAFHQFDSPMFPLYVRSTVHGLGKSSKSILYELFHEGTDTLYASCDITHVLVSKATRKPVRFPDWWTDKYASLIEGDRAQLPMLEDPSDASTYSSSVTVKPSEIDHVFHTNWATFIQYCCDNLYAGMSSKAFPNLSISHWNSGVRSVDMGFKAEANLGDNLTMQSWEHQTRRDSACSRILKGPNICYHANFTFYSDHLQHKM